MSARIREVEERDLEAVSGLIARVFGRPVPADGAARLRWLLFENPDSWPGLASGWILEEAGEPVGFLANVARRMSAGGRDVLAACTAKYVVSAAHRMHGLLLAKAFFEQRGVDLLFCSTASESSAPVLKRFGAAEIAGGNQAAMFVLRGAPVVSELMRRRGYQGTLARIASGGVGAALTVLERVRCRPPQCPAGIRVQPLTGFDGRLDDLWERCESRRLITSRRDARRMQWLFFDGPASRPESKVLGAFRGDRLDGYMVCQDRHQTRGVRRRETMDLFTAVEDEDAVEALVAHALEDAESDAMDTLEFRSLPPPLTEQLVSWGARRRTLEVNPFLAKALNPELRLPAGDAGRWYLSPADGDGAAW